MSGLGTGIAAMVNGFASGRDIKHRWEDRKDQKEWDKKLQEYRAKAESRLDDRHGWAGEEMGMARDRHGVSMGAADRSQRAWEQQWADDQSLRDALGAAVDAGEGGVSVPAEITPASVSTKSPDVAPQAAGQERPSVATASGHSVGLGAVRPVSPDAVQPNSDTSAPAASQAAPAAAVSDLFEELPGGKVIATRAPRTAEERAAIMEAAKSGRLTQSADDAARQSQIDQTGMAMATANPVARALQADPNADRWGKGTAGTDIKETAKEIGRGALMVPEAMANAGLKGVRQAQEVMDVPRRWIFGRESEKVGSVDLNGDGKNNGIIRETGGMPAPKGATKTEAAVAEGAAQVMDALGDDPAMQAAAATTELGVDPGKPLTVKQRENAASTFMESYRKNGVPLVQKELMRQGKFAEAEALTGFVNDQAAQEGMKNWSRGVFAAMNGDLEGAADAMMDAYNSSGYFDDGMEIVKDQSSLIRDDKGDVTGVRLAIRDQATGEVTVQEDSIEDVINKGLWLTSPEKAMEVYVQRQQAIQDQLIAADEARRKQAAGLIEKDFDAINEAALELMKVSVGLDGKPTLTYEEALQEVQRARGGGAAPAGDTPVLRRAE